MIAHSSRFKTETYARGSTRGWLAAGALVLALGALAATACSGRASPIGWAGARPVQVDSQDIILVPHKAKLYALQPESSTANWIFPPKQKDAYPLSEDASGRIKDLIDATGLESTAKKELEQRVDDVRLAGKTKDALNDAVDASAATDGEKKDIRSTVDEAVKFEADALKKLKAIYGDLGVSADGGTVYVTTFRGIVFALDTHTGTARWIRDAGDQIVGGVAVDGDTIFFGTKGKKLYAVDARNGERLWDFEASGEVWSTPAIDGGTLYITSLDGAVYAIDKATGTQKWAFDGADSGIAASPVVVDGVVYVGAFDNRLYAIKAADGTMKWSIKAGNWFWAKPVVAEGIVYAASLDGKVYAVRADDGSDAWPKPFDAGAPVRSSPVVVGNGVVVAARNAQLYKLTLEAGEQMDGSPLDLEGESKVEADLAIADGNLVYLVPRSAAVWIIEAESGLRSRGSFPLTN